MSNEHFCTCPSSSCPRHPGNHENGCDPCIKHNLQNKKMPACMFFAVSEDANEVSDYSMKSFVEFFLKHQHQEV